MVITGQRKSWISQLCFWMSWSPSSLSNSIAFVLLICVLVISTESSAYVGFIFSCQRAKGSEWKTLNPTCSSSTAILMVKIWASTGKGTCGNNQLGQELSKCSKPVCTVTGREAGGVSEQLAFFCESVELLRPWRMKYFPLLLGICDYCVVGCWFRGKGVVTWTTVCGDCLLEQLEHSSSSLLTDSPASLSAHPRELKGTVW